MAQVLGELADGGEFEKIGERDFCLQDLLQIGMNSDQEQGIASEVEEIVVEPYKWNSQYTLPEFCEGALEMAANGSYRGGILFQGHL